MKLCTSVRFFTSILFKYTVYSYVLKSSLTDDLYTFFILLTSLTNSITPSSKQEVTVLARDYKSRKKVCSHYSFTSSLSSHFPLKYNSTTCLKASFLFFCPVFFSNSLISCSVKTVCTFTIFIMLISVIMFINLLGLWIS